MIKIAVTTNQAHVSTALMIKKLGNFYFEFAKTNPWNDDKHPNQEDPTLKNLPQSQVFLKADKVSLVYDGGITNETEDTSKYVIYGKHKWNYSSDANAYDNNAHYILFEGTLQVQEVPAFTYHQIGIRNKAELAGNAHAVPIESVTNKGILYFYENRSEQIYTDAMKLNVTYIARA